ncbi:4-(cytidine 5'-diphospho)-2-C-methyl-D-erythritol kinase [Curtanaerobium respiraculi]|uniref:4-(cytidine 5'-diphospho)-2-C-methyl-D-erythritol kinase n=1 Tax=Curtanaerobium respiraculi TaxID=2949669 RepID=UPI0024B3413C|nr:4-(cytidine 5'-diphospho)-2-C-methyl-D-erythritol kinase [Curtanaerobium respiraculi]
MKSIDLIAPAKVNLYLGIGRKRDDGYHDATTVMHALSMHDKLHMTLLGSGERTVLFEPCDAAQPLRQFEAAVDPHSGLAVSANTVWRTGIAGENISDEDNLACRAVRALAEALGRHEDELMRITIEKHIPHQTGLGGGSADAAAALLGAADLWGIPATDPMLAEAARALGADVLFFLKGGCAALGGRGDEFAGTLTPRHDSVVIIRPEGGVSTAQAYATFDNDPAFPTPGETEAILAHTAASEVALSNNLAAPAEKILPELADIRAFARAIDGVTDVLLCGSGSGTLAVCKDMKTAQALSAAARQKGWWARTTSFSSIRAAKLPEKK